MRRKRFTLFLVLSGLFGLLIALGILSTIASPYYIVSLVVTLFMIIFILFIYRRIVRWVVPSTTKEDSPKPDETAEEKAPQPQSIKENVAGTPLEAAYKGLFDYILKNESTPFFKSKLQALLQSIESFGQKYNKLDLLLKDKFGEGALSYEKFMQPISHACERLTAGSELLVHNLWHFDEEVYTRKINDLRASGKAKEAEQYVSVEQEYKTQVYGLSSEFDTVNLKLDRLLLEIGRLGGSETEINVDEIDTLIEDIKLYR